MASSKIFALYATFTGTMYQTAGIRIQGDVREYTEIKRGVRQGCVFSPDLFNLYSEIILRCLQDLPGVVINGQNINNIRYADDTVLIADSEEQLQALLNAVILASAEYGLTINASKTKCKVISRSGDERCYLAAEGTRIDQVKQFNYLGSLITSDGRCEMEIRRRIRMARSPFGKMGKVFQDHNITLPTKLRLLHCYIHSILTYGSESWTLTTRDKGRLDATEKWFLRRLLRIPWSDFVSNEKVLNSRHTEYFDHKHQKTSKLFLWSHYAERKMGELSNDWETKWEERQGSPQNEPSRQHEAVVGSLHPTSTQLS